MSFHDLMGWDKTVFKAKITKAQGPGLIHTNMNSLAAECVADSPNHLLNECIGFSLANHQNVSGVPQ